MQNLCVGSRVGGHYVYAKKSIEQGEVICDLEGTITVMPTRYSIQVGAEEHLTPLHSIEDARNGGPSSWVYTNHSCSANARVIARQLVAVQPIAEGEEVTFDYEASEGEMAEPFNCLCGSPNCRRSIRGFCFLDEATKISLLPILAPYFAETLELSQVEIAP